MSHRPFIVGIGGTTSPGSSTECALTLALKAAENCGAQTRIFNGTHLAGLPHYAQGIAGGKTPGGAIARDFLDAMRAADGVIFASPGYHGSISGLVKNAVDYLEETARDTRVYLDGIPVGLIVTAYGWQATGSTLAALRSIVHALRGWPTPFGAAVNASGGMFAGGLCSDAAVMQQLQTVGRQTVDFARVMHGNLFAT